MGSVCATPSQTLFYKTTHAWALRNFVTFTEATFGLGSREKFYEHALGKKNTVAYNKMIKC